MTDVTTRRLALQTGGYAPIPVRGKKALLPEWQTQVGVTAAEIASWALKFPQWPNTGILTVDTPGLDADIRHPEAAAAVEEMVKDWFDGRGVFLTRFGEAPKRLMLFQTAQPFAKIRAEFVAPDKSEHAIEVLGSGQQVVVDGIHPGTRRPYSWHANRAPWAVPRNELPEINETEARALVQLISEMLREQFSFELVENPGGTTSDDVGRTDNSTDAGGQTLVHGGKVDVAVEFASMHDGASTNAAQTRIIPSLLRKGEHPDDVLELVVDRTMAQVGMRLGWTREAESKVVRSRIISAYGNLLMKDYDPATGVIPSWLPGEFHEVWAAKLKAGQRPVFGFNGGGFYVRKQQGSAGDAVKEQTARPKSHTDETAKTAHKGRFKLVAFSDLQLGTDPLYLVDELIPIRGLVDVWGKAKCCKSFWTYDLCFHIAQGWEYRDRYVQQGAVVYCAFEGAHGYKKRKAALKQHYNIEEGAQVPLYLVSETINLISEHSLLIAAITAQLGGTKPAVVVLDTLNKSLVGSENKDVDMGAYVRAAEAIRDAFDCVVIIVHHCGYDDTRPRGHSSLPAAVDAQLAVTRAENVVTVTVEMMRDGPEETQIVSEVVPVEVGMDRNGKVLTSLVVVPGSADAAATRSDLPRGLAVFRSALIGALAGHGEAFQPEAGVLPVRAVNQWHIRDLFYATYAEAEEDEKKRQAKVQKAFVRALGDAQSRGMIRTLRTVDDARIMVWRPERQDGA